MIENMLGEVWRQYEDTPYYFSNCGRVKRRWKTKEVLLNPYSHHRNRKKSNAKLLLVKVHGKPVNVAQVIFRLFVGEVPDGYVVHHKDNNYFNNDVRNLELLSQNELGKKTGGRTSRRKLVYCADNDKIYRGTRAAAKDLFVSRQTICDICNKKVKRKPIVNVRWMRQ